MARHVHDKRNFNWSALGDWIQFAASVGGLLGFVLVIVYVASTRLLTGPEQSNQAEIPRENRVHNQVVVTKERQLELIDFVEQVCPACHGPHMEGSIGPALSNADLQHLGVNAIALTILYGLPEMGMPPWERQLSQGDAQWIAGYLKRGGTRR